jgi:hypothetical protein
MRSKEIIASIAVVGCVAALALFNLNTVESGQTLLQTGQYDAVFNSYIARYGKRYGTKEEYLYRLNIFVKNYHLIMDHNTMNSEDLGFEMAINHFADLTESEFKMHLGYNGPRSTSQDEEENISEK